MVALESACWLGLQEEVTEDGTWCLDWRDTASPSREERQGGRGRVKREDEERARKKMMEDDMEVIYAYV